MPLVFILSPVVQWEYISFQYLSYQTNGPVNYELIYKALAMNLVIVWIKLL